MGKKYTYDEIKLFIESKGCELISTEYKNSKEKLKIKCNCGEVFERSFNDFKSKKMYCCSCCSGNKLSYNEVKLFIESKGCKLISTEYKNNSTKLEIQCQCGNVYCVDFNTFKKEKQYQCPSCGNKKRIEKMRNKEIFENGYYTIEKVKEIIESKTELKVLSKTYNGCFEKLKLQCSCGNIFYQSFNYILSKINKNKLTLCPKCTKKIKDNKFKLSREQINLKIFNYYGYQKYILCDENNYINNTTKMLFKHISCGEIFKASLHDLITGNGYLCPSCEIKESKGVIKIKKYLKENNIAYETEKTFENCKYKNLLRFDFYLTKYNALIEFDGPQHFKPIDYFGGKETFENTKIRDKIKNNYCKENEIKLIRIHYKRINNINDILDNFIDKLTPR